MFICCNVFDNNSDVMTSVSFDYYFEQFFYDFRTYYVHKKKTNYLLVVVALYSQSIHIIM